MPRSKPAATLTLCVAEATKFPKSLPRARPDRACRSHAQMETSLADAQTDPARLSGDALRRWYLRTPQEIESERQAAATLRRLEFFDGGTRRDQDPESWAHTLEQYPYPGLALLEPKRNPDPGFDIELGISQPAFEPGFRWTRPGPVRWRQTATLGPGEAARAGSWDAPEVNPRAGWSPAEIWSPPGSRGPGRPTLAAPAFFNTVSRSAPLAAPSALTAEPVKQLHTPVSQPYDRRSAAGSGTQPQIGTYGPPTTSPKPSFFSYLFGGPAPITSPGGNVVGYYDHDAGKVGLQITAAYASIASIFHPAGWMEVVGTKAASPVIRAIDQGILEALQRHHPVPLHMGGRWLQELAPLRTSLHTDLHRMLRTAFKEVGFPKVGGKGGSKADWVAHFEANPDSYSKALEILQRVTRDFDKTRGTNVTTYLERELAMMAERTRRKAP